MGSVEVIPIGSLQRCSLLRVPEIGYVLLDCGMSETLDVSHLLQLTPYLKELVLVLITQSDLAHCGGLPFLRHLLTRSTGPRRQDYPLILATEATQRIGEITVCSLIEDISALRDPVTVGADSQLMFSIEDTVAAFQTITPVQYGESVKLGQLEIVANCSGRLLGGAWFSLDVTGDSGQKMVYCVDYNLGTSRFMKGGFMDPIKTGRTGLMITDVGQPEITDVRGSSQADLKQSITHVLRKEGSVLLPVDSTGQVLELLIMLEEWWQEETAMRNFPIVFISSTGDVLIDQVRGRLEWMNQRVVDKFNSSNNFSYNPFLFEHITFFPDHVAFLEAFPNTRMAPKVIVASGLSLEFGEAREVFFKVFAGDANNAVLFAEHPACMPRDSLAAKLVDGRIAQGATFAVAQASRVPLNDEQLREFYRKKLEDERIEDELRRRRFRERERVRLGLLNAEGAEGGAGGPMLVDLATGAGRGWGFDEAELTGEDATLTGFFRPRLFNALTRTNPTSAGTSEAARMPGGLSEYGSAVGRTDVDTWRAHSNAGNLKGVGTVDEEEEAGAVKKQQVKQMKTAKNEASEGIKDEKKNLSLDASLGFDWRRDLAVRFGEPMRTEIRERQAKLLCKIQRVAAPLGSSFCSTLMRNEVFSLVPANAMVALLPSEGGDGTTHAQLAELAKFGFEQKLRFFELRDGPIRVTLRGKRKLALLKIDQLAMASVGNHAVAVVPRPTIKALTEGVEEIVNPLGERIEVTVAAGVADESSETPSVFLADHKISLAEIKRWLADAGTDAEFCGPATNRWLDVLDGRLCVKISEDGLIDVSGEHDLLAGLRAILYKKLRVV